MYVRNSHPSPLHCDSFRSCFISLMFRTGPVFWISFDSLISVNAIYPINWIIVMIITAIQLSYVFRLSAHLYYRSRYIQISYR